MTPLPPPSFPLQGTFLEKNNDALHASLEELVAVSRDPFVKKLFPEAVAAPSTSSHAKKLVLVSVGSKFRVSCVYCKPIPINVMFVRVPGKMYV